MQQTLVTFLLDRTGSMSSIRGATIESFNAYLTELQQEDTTDILFTFLQFDSIALDKLYVATPVKEVPLLTFETFVPRGNTPLVDAAYKTIKAVEEAIATSGSKPKVVICVQTDGEENCSEQYTIEELQGLISARTDEGWQFNFMGAGIDAYKDALKMGFSQVNTMSYDSADLRASRAAFRATASNARGFATGQSVNTSYSAGQKQAAGDAYVGSPTPTMLKNQPIKDFKL